MIIIGGVGRSTMIDRIAIIELSMTIIGGAGRFTVISVLSFLSHR